jgi:DNA polymerase-3 subunit delta'
MDENWNTAGHSWAVEMLRQHVKRGTARHAYLFTGPAGVGRRTLALRFAQALNCTEPGQTGVPCGKCDDCERIEARRHADVTIVEADEQGGTLKVDQIREQRRVLALKPYQAKYRVAIFARFQEANDAASNALLKTLEEAPAHAVLVLTAESSEGLLPTIVSRCEVLRLQPVPLPEVQSFLERRGARPEQARLLAHISAGCPGTAVRLMEDEAALAYRDEKLGELLELLQATRARRFAYAEKIGRDRADLRGLLLLWLSFWRDVLWRAGGASSPISNIDRQQEIDALARRLSLSDAKHVVERLDQAVRGLESNVNPRLIAEVLLLDWPR